MTIHSTNIDVPLFGDDGSILRVTVRWHRDAAGEIALLTMEPANVPQGRTDIRDLGPKRAADLCARIEDALRAANSRIQEASK